MKKILIVAGETSGDLHAANLMSELKSQSGSDGPPRFMGLGGTKMVKAGLELLEPITQHAGTGLDPLFNIIHFTRIFRKLVAHIRQEKPDIAILVDFPDFNLRLAKRIKESNIPVVYYISPQIWAWRPGRIRIIQKYVDKMIVIFPFEEELYQKAHVPVEFVGHPLLDALTKKQGAELLNLPDKERKQQTRKILGLNPKDLIIGLLPGSRPTEFQRHFPIILKSLTGISASAAGTRAKYILAAAPDITPELTARLMSKYPIQLTTFQNQTYEVLMASDLLITVSGTITMEAALFKTPMVVIYKVPLITELAFSALIKTPYYAMVNIIARKRIMPELIQRDCAPAKIAQTVISLLESGQLNQMRLELATVKEKMGQPGASKRAAQAIWQILHKT